MEKELCLKSGRKRSRLIFSPKVLTDMDTLIRREFDANRIGYGQLSLAELPGGSFSWLEIFLKNRPIN